MHELIIKADTDNLDKVITFVEEQLEAFGCPMKVQTQIDIAVEEIFVNIAHYAYTSEIGDVSIMINLHDEPKEVTIVFMDSGIPYNPLERPDPDTSLSAEERQIGGLGIYMVKKSVDFLEYEYRDGKNVFTIGKKF